LRAVALGAYLSASLDFDSLSGAPASLAAWVKVDCNQCAR
jgi:hypothetical protein